MPQTYSFNPKQALTIDAPIRNFTVEQGSVVVSKHDEVIPTTVSVGEDFAAGDRGGLDFFSPDSAMLTVLFTDEAKLAESGRRAGEKDVRGGKRRSKPSAKKKRSRKKKKTAAKKTASRGDTGGGDTGGFESRTLTQLRAEAAKREIPGRSKMDKTALIAALRGKAR